MKFKIIFLMIILFNLTICKKKESIVEDVEPFYLDASEGCPVTAKNQPNCVTIKNELNCYMMLQDVRFHKMDQVFNNTNWTSPDFNEHTYNYYVDQKGSITILAGGPSEARAEYEHIGDGRVYKEGKDWIYKQECDQEKCEKLNFSIEYINCSVRYYQHDNEHRLFLTIGNRYYDHYDEIEKRKFLSMVLQDPVKPQIENGFELYLVPPPPK
ncbi:hypothetical protein JWG41_06245 [Leptospira sp. 201903075]|uniref:hypothetical protein n=1 Tax=Leptospira chreensis TaxID=2810035 RepID=UPI0019655633|nr:hypothetical protein [Leptospira chreensis]MBM9590038.1 hypothetical protein [Leptospira chreensis]